MPINRNFGGIPKELVGAGRFLEGINQFGEVVIAVSGDVSSLLCL